MRSFSFGLMLFCLHHLRCFRREKRSIAETTSRDWNRIARLCVDFAQVLCFVLLGCFSVCVGHLTHLICALWIRNAMPSRRCSACQTIELEFEKFANVISPKMIGFPSWHIPPGSNAARNTFSIRSTHTPSLHLNANVYNRNWNTAINRTENVNKELSFRRMTDW